MRRTLLFVLPALLACDPEPRRAIEVCDEYVTEVSGMTCITILAGVTDCTPNRRKTCVRSHVEESQEWREWKSRNGDAR